MERFDSPVLESITAANVEEYGEAKAKQIHAAASLFIRLAMAEKDLTAAEMVICLARGCGIGVESIAEVVKAAWADHDALGSGE